MYKKDLVESLEFFRAERPDEWIMDDFIRQTKIKNRIISVLEAKLKKADSVLDKISKETEPILDTTDRFMQPTVEALMAISVLNEIRKKT